MRDTAVRSFAVALLTGAIVFLQPVVSAQEQTQADSDPDPDISRPSEIPGHLDTSLRQLSDGKHFNVSLRSLAGSTKINEIHNWAVTVRTRKGKTVGDAKIEFDGGMPAHNHGFPTSPRVTKQITDGTYLLEGVKFNMTGRWRFEFKIRAGEISDRVRFDVVVEE